MIKPAETICIAQKQYSSSRNHFYCIIESQKKELSALNSKVSSLTSENENFRRIFETALDQFAKKELRLKTLERELEHEKRKNKELEKETKRLNSKLNKAIAKANKFASMLFGIKSEKIDISNVVLADDEIIDITFEEAESNDPESAEQNKYDKKAKRGARKGHSGNGRKKVPKNLPVKENFVDIEDKNKTCSHCGLPKIELNGMEKIYYDYFEVFHEVLIEEMQKASRLHADETRWHVFLDGYKKLWYMWGFRSENMVLFVLDPTRAADVPLKTLFNLTESEIEEIKSKDNAKLLEIPVEQIKKLNVDRFSSYKVLAKYGLVLLSFCWAHQRRDYTDLKKKYDKNPELCLWADEWLQRIAKLYHINNQRVTFEKDSEEFKKFDTELKNSRPPHFGCEA